MIGPDSLLGLLDPLQEAHRRVGSVALVPGDARDVERVAMEYDGRRTAILVVEDPAQESRRSRCASPFLERACGPDALVGWLRLDKRRLAGYARRAASLLSRRDEPEQPVVLLGPRERRYLDLLDEIERTAAPRSGTLNVFRWSAERIRRGPMVNALRSGVAAVLYAGHGNQDGWFAYGGLGAGAFAAGSEWSDAEASALMFSLSCRTGLAGAPDVEGARPPASGFADSLVSIGVAGAVLAPVGDPLHADNRVLAAALLRALGAGRRRLDEVLDAARLEGASLRGYAVIGDPALRAVAAPQAAGRAARVFAPAAHAEVAPRTFEDA